MGFIGFSGAYTLQETMPLLKEACSWASSQSETMKILFLVGHWDSENLGCKNEMDVPSLYEQISKLDGCDKFDAKKALKFFMGHTHCNIPHPHNHVDTGFMVAGQGICYHLY